MMELLSNLCRPEWIMAHGGLYIVVLIVFAETGLFAGFFLPGDTLLFVTGVILANTNEPLVYEAMNLCYWMVLIIVSGIAGNFTGYWFGRKSGVFLLERKDSWIFKKKHLVTAKEFYERKGGGAIVIARFLPVVRTFAPIIAGIVQMNLSKFLTYNIIGSIAWVFSMVMAGYLLGNFAWVKDHLEFIMLFIVLVTTFPLILKVIKDKKQAKRRV